MKKILIICLMSILVFSTANATLIVDITGTAGSGNTTWTFSGSSTAGASGFFEDDGNLASTDTWSNIGDYTQVNDFENLALTGSATLTIGSQTRNIILVYIDDDSGVQSDDFGVGVDGSSNFLFNSGDLVSWSGSLLVSGIDINDLSESGYPMSYETSTYGNVNNALAFKLNIGNSAPTPSVPAPAAIWLMLSGLLGLMVMRKQG